jgi:hypothetical protein
MAHVMNSSGSVVPVDVRPGGGEQSPKQAVAMTNMVEDKMATGPAIKAVSEAVRGPLNKVQSKGANKAMRGHEQIGEG